MRRVRGRRRRNQEDRCSLRRTREKAGASVAMETLSNMATITPVVFIHTVHVSVYQFALFGLF